MSATTAPTPTEEVITIARTTMLGDLAKLIVDELRMAPTIWVKLPEDQQQKTIERIRERLEPIIGDCARMIASGSRTALRAKVLPFAVKQNSLELKLSMPKTHESGRAALDAVGTECIVTFPSIEDYLGGGETVKAEPNQKPLPLGDAAEKPKRGRPKKSAAIDAADAAKRLADEDAGGDPCGDELPGQLEQAAAFLGAQAEAEGGVRHNDDIPRRPPAELLQADPALATLIARPYVIRPKGEPTGAVIGVWAKTREDALRLFEQGWEGADVSAVDAEICFPAGLKEYGCLNPYHAPETAEGRQAAAS